MGKLRLPCRAPVGDMRNFRRVLAVNKRLQVLGKKYRKAVPKSERSFRRWLEFLHENEPVLVGHSKELTGDAYAAAPRR